ncbi:MAG: hypothetical protein ACFFAK_16710 [Promethearchaeota archaeon]
MKIIKIIDGFITNSSTQTTTILLAIHKGKNLSRLFEEIQSYEEYPLDFFQFTNHEKDLYEFFETQNVNLTYLNKEYDLYINTVPDSGLECDTEDDVHIRFNKLSKMINEIQNKLKDHVLVLFYGDILHNGFHFDSIPIYSKDEIKGIFQSENAELIQSLIKNRVVKNLKYSSEELENLAKNINIPLIQIIEPISEDWDEFWFNKLYFEIFRVDYIGALLQYGKNSIPSRHNICNYHYTRQICLTMLKREFEKPFQGASFIHEKLAQNFCTTIDILKNFYGSDELIVFLEDNTYFDLLGKLPEWNFINVPVLKLIADSILEALESNIINNRTRARKIHANLMKILHSYIISEYKFEMGTFPLINQIIRPYIEQRKQELIKPIINTIPFKILTEIINTTKDASIKSIMSDVLKLHNDYQK